MLRRWLAIALLLALQGCATQSAKFVDESYAGPTAIIVDTATGGGRSGGTFFVLAEVDGKPAVNALGSSMSASSGQGMHLKVQQMERKVKAGATQLKLVGRVGYAAPIQQIFKSDSSYAVEGVIDVTLKPDTRYRVAGILDSFRREVWLEEEVSSQVIGQKVVGTADAKALATSAADATFTCCNLHYEGDWISDANYAKQPFVPAGSRIKINDYGRYRASVTIEGRQMRIGQDHGRAQESTEKYVTKLVVKEDPNLKIATFPSKIQAAIRAGKVMQGMTKEQVIISLGYPRTDGTRSTDLDQWTYWADTSGEYVVVWGADGRLKEIAGTPRIKELVLHTE